MGNNLKKQENNDNNIQNDPSSIKLSQEEELIKLNDRVTLLEQNLLNKFTSPLDNTSVFYENIPITFYGENTYLHTLVYGLKELKENSEKKVIIMLHGYQGNSLNFYKIIPYIYEKFICICPDIIGMGLSSRVNVQFTSNEQCIDFFVESIEAFRISLEKNYNLNKKFIFCAHSLGGYFAVNYAIKYPQNIESLFLMSPTGISDVQKYGGSICENMGFMMSLGMKASSPLWKFKPTIQDISQKFLIKNIINFSLRKRYNLSPEENEIMAEITEITLKYPKDLDAAIYFIFKYPFPTPVIPMEDIIKEKIPDMNIIFCYGENDWMDNSGAKRLNQFDKNKYKYFTVSKAGHTFPLDNPIEAAKILMEEL